MASTPDGSVIDGINAGEDGPPLPRIKKRMAGKNAQPPHPLEDIMAIETKQVVCTHVGDIIQIFWDPQPVDQLVAALHDTGLNTNPKHQKHHGLDPDSVTQMVKADLESEFLPQFSKDYQVKDLMCTC